MGDDVSRVDEPTEELPTIGDIDDLFRDNFPRTGNGYEPVVTMPGWNAPAEKSERKPRARRPLLIAAVAVFLAGVLTAIALVPRLVGGSTSTEAAAAPGGGTSVSGPVEGLETATFDLVDGAGSIELRAGDLGGDLYRIATPAGSGVTPRVDREGGAVQVFLPAGEHGGAAAVEVVLNASVRWTVRVNGGADRTLVDLTGAVVDAVDLAGGANRIELTLPAPGGLVPVRMTGGVDQFQVRVPGTTPVRVRVQAGAGQVTLGGETHRGIAPGRSFTANGWGTGGTGIDVLAVAGMAALTVTSPG